MFDHGPVPQISGNITHVSWEQSLISAARNSYVSRRLAVSMDLVLPSIIVFKSCRARWRSTQRGSTAWYLVLGPGVEPELLSPRCPVMIDADGFDEILPRIKTNEKWEPSPTDCNPNLRILKASMSTKIIGDRMGSVQLSVLINHCWDTTSIKNWKAVMSNSNGTRAPKRWYRELPKRYDFSRGNHRFFGRLVYGQEMMHPSFPTAK